QPRRTHILNPRDRATAHRLETGFQQQLLEKRIANLHGRAFLECFFVKLRGSHRRAVNSIAPGLCPNIEHRISNTSRFTEEDLIVTHESERKRIHEGIERVSI